MEQGEMLGVAETDVLKGFEKGKYRRLRRERGKEGVGRSAWEVSKG